MKIAVLIKYCPDSEAAVDVVDDQIKTSGLKFSVSAYDEYACEEALQKVEAAGDGEVIVINVGPEINKKGIQAELARGAHRAVHVVTDEEVSCPVYVARLLVEVLKEESPDLIIGGWKGIDYDQALTLTMVAEMMGLPHVNIVTKLDIADGTAVAHRQVDGGEEIIEVSLPAVIGAQKGLNEPRYPSLKGIMKAKKKPMKKIAATEMGVEHPGDGAKFLKFEKPPSKQAGKMFEGPESAAEVVRLLREEAKVI